jgi:two-component system, chemotaxis family, protein-glutamate methylesterase/glutaminase
VTHVLVVDDSAVLRTAFAAILGAARDFTVETASDPLIAMRKMAQRRPGVIVLDLEMPNMDGLTFLRGIMSSDPIPVVICSGMANRESDLGIRALEDGAVDIIAKPKLGVRDFVEGYAREIIEVIRNAAASRPRRRASSGVAQPTTAAARPAGIRYTTDKIVAVAASTGGTEAIRTLLQAMPPDAPALVIVQHMPAVFTAAFAKRLHEVCRIEVKEAAAGDKVTAGRALIAPGSRHTLVRKSGAHYVIEISDEPPVSHHRPSADLLFRSVAQAAGPNAIGVVLTGMGDDGSAGLLEMRKSGAGTFAQDEASCVVFGMPRKAIERGAVQEVTSINTMADAVLRWIRRSEFVQKSAAVN